MFIYVALQIAGNVIILLYYTLMSVFMGCCKMGICLFLQVGQQILNVGVLCPIFLYKTNLGILGSSLAIILSYIPFTIIAIVLLQTKSPINIRPNILWKNRSLQLLQKYAGIGLVDMISSASGMIILSVV